MQFFGKTQFDFLSKRKFFLILSVIIMVTGLALTAILGLDYGIDFEGGTELAVQFESPVETDRIREGVASLGITGTEIKSIRAHKANINDCYARIRNGEAFVINMHISPYNHGNIFNHEETRERKLLLHKKEIQKMHIKVKVDGLVLIPTKLYLKDALCKIEIAVCKSKNLYDKRQSLKEADQKRRMDKVVKNFRF